MTTEHFDIVVIGAGIHGAGIAQAAACYGYRILVLEKNGVAAGTSSRSSKLIHGGLRYLESGQFSLVRECLRERDLLLRLAPELVRMRPFCIPVYEYSSRSAAKIGLGLSLYAMLAGLRESSRYKRIPRHYWDQMDGLSTEKLLAVFQYHDAQTDDKELTKAVLQSALNMGAELRLPAHFVGARIIRETKKHCEVQYVHNGEQHQCTATLLINAAGPWVNEVLAKINPKQIATPVDLVQGTHIVLQAPFGERVYYLEAPQDRRAVFVMPWKNHVMIGTTETLFTNTADNVTPLTAEMEYLRDTFSHYFPEVYRQHPQVIDQFAGLRVLPATRASAFHRPRDTRIQLDDLAQPSVASLYGGKLTAYRATAEKLLNRLLPVLPRQKQRADTKRLPLQPVDVIDGD
jgi:glycerol-3-phosphate dehydrogenase